MTRASTSPGGLPGHGSDAAVDRDVVEVPQYRLRRILGVWAAAALPMAALAWLVAPALAGRLSGEGPVPMFKALLVCLTAGLVWQFVLALVLVRREQGTIRWPVLRQALWLRPPVSPRSGRAGGRVWLVLIPLTVLFAVEGILPEPPAPVDRDLSHVLGSGEGQAFLDGAWGWFTLMLVLWVFNALGEELLFRGLLLPRMNGTFGRGDWVANGILFAAYHLHVPWRIPATLLDTFILAYPTKRYRSAWIAIVVHSTQALVFAGIVLALVL